MAGNPEQARQLNRSLILGRLKNDGTASRIEIAKALDLSKMTVSVIVSDLIDERLIDEVGEGEAAKSGGRKPILLTLGGSRYVIGFDIGQENTAVALSNLKGEIIDERKIPTHRDKSVDRIIQQIANLTTETVEKNRISVDAILGVGVSAAGLVDKERGHILFSPDFNWKEVPLRTILAEKMSFPVVVDNCTRVLALGETWYGGAKESNNLFFINVGHGIGSALLINGEIYGNNSEFGHVRVTRNNVRCDCGKMGCLEAVSSGHAIERKAYKVYGDRDGWVTAEMLAGRADAGEEKAREIFCDAGRYLGRAVAMAVNLFNPDKVIIGGGVSRSGRLLLEPLMKEFRDETMEVIKDTTSVELTKLGTESGVRGAVALALDAFLFEGSKAMTGGA